jgi:hypothetical protein
MTWPCHYVTLLIPVTKTQPPVQISSLCHSHPTFLKKKTHALYPWLSNMLCSASDYQRITSALQNVQHVADYDHRTRKNDNICITVTMAYLKFVRVKDNEKITEYAESSIPHALRGAVLHNAVQLVHESVHCLA